MKNLGISNTDGGNNICIALRQDRTWHIFEFHILFHSSGHTHGKMFESDDSIEA